MFSKDPATSPDCRSKYPAPAQLGNKLKLRRLLPVAPGSENKIFQRKKSKFPNRGDQPRGSFPVWSRWFLETTHLYFFSQSLLCCSGEFPRHHRKVVTVLLRSILNFPCLEPPVKYVRKFLIISKVSNSLGLEGNFWSLLSQ